MRIRTSSFATILLLNSSFAYADDRCAGYVGKIVKPETFKDLASTLDNTAPKGEFETTVDYQKRLASAQSGGPRIISKEFEDPKFFEYDADGARLRIKAYAFNTGYMDFWSAFYDNKSDIKASVGDNIATVISQKDAPGGTFDAQNGYGAHFTVTRINRVTEAVFDRKAEVITKPNIGYEQIIPSDANGYVGQILMSPTEAQKLKPKIRIVFIVQPRVPFLVQGKHQVGKVTTQNPVEVTESFSILIVNIQCGMLIDDNNRVLASYDAARP